jgi:hypothetical protein
LPAILAARRSLAVNCGRVFAGAVDGENGVLPSSESAIPPHPLGLEILFFLHTGHQPTTLSDLSATPLRGGLLVLAATFNHVPNGRLRDAKL